MFLICPQLSRWFPLTKIANQIICRASEAEPRRHLCFCAFGKADNRVTIFLILGGTRKISYRFIRDPKSIFRVLHLQALALTGDIASPAVVSIRGLTRGLKALNRPLVNLNTQMKKARSVKIAIWQCRARGPFVPESWWLTSERESGNYRLSEIDSADVSRRLESKYYLWTFFRSQQGWSQRVVRTRLRQNYSVSDEMLFGHNKVPTSHKTEERLCWMVIQNDAEVSYSDNEEKEDGSRNREREAKLTLSFTVVNKF